MDLLAKTILSAYPVTFSAPRYCTTSYITVYSAASGSPYDAASICISIHTCSERSTHANRTVTIKLYN